MRPRDVVVIGAGHNALVVACYLARERLDVEVVELDTVVGGEVSTIERFPGGFAPFATPDGGQAAITFWADLDRSCGSIAQVCGQAMPTPTGRGRRPGRTETQQFEVDLDAMYTFRPLPELAGYRTPIAGPYLCGASTHPGAGVFGASGRSAVRVLLADRSRRLAKHAKPRA